MRPLVSVAERGQDGGQNRGDQGSEVGEDLADVVPAAAQDGEDRVPGGALQRAAREAPVGFHVADPGLDGAAAAEPFRQRGRDTLSGAADQHLRLLHIMPAVAAVDNRQGGLLPGQCLDLLQRFSQRMPVTGGPWQGPHANDEAPGRPRRWWWRC